MRVEEKTLSHIPDAHAADIREKGLIVKNNLVPTDDGVMKLLDKKIEWGPNITDKTFSQNPEAHSNS